LPEIIPNNSVVECYIFLLKFVTWVHNPIRMKSVYLLSIHVFLFLILYSCEKIQSYPPEPELTFNSYKVENTLDGLGNKVVQIEAKINFVDGDGDLIVEIDTSGYDTVLYNKLYILHYQKISGIYQLVPNTTNFNNPEKIRLDFVEFMRRDGQNKTFKGTITKYITYYAPPFDTVKLGFYIYDRAYHKSNILEIPDIPLTK
jgi:hypothetical protein